MALLNMSFLPHARGMLNISYFIYKAFNHSYNCLTRAINCTLPIEKKKTIVGCVLKKKEKKKRKKKIAPSFPSTSR